MLAQNKPLLKGLVITVFVFAAALIIFLATSKPAKTAYKVLALLSALNPSTSQLKEPPNLKPAIVYYQDGDKQTEAEIFRKGYQNQGAVIISGGVALTDYNWALINAFAANLANLGITVMIPKPEMATNDIVTKDGIKSYVNAFKYLEGQNKIDKSKIGFFGFCAGGSFVLLASEDPEINNRVSVVSAFSPYNDLIDYYSQAFSHEAITQAGERPWEPAPETVSALTTNFNYRLTQSTKQNNPKTQNVSSLLAAISQKGSAHQTKDTLLGSLPESFIEDARQLSPSTNATNIKAKVYIIHDYNDTFTPREESLRLAAEIGPNAKLVIPTIFDHTILQQNISPIKWLTEGSKIIMFFYQTLYYLA